MNNLKEWIEPTYEIFSSKKTETGTGSFSTESNYTYDMKFQVS